MFKNNFKMTYFYKRVYPTRHDNDILYSNAMQITLNKIKIDNIEEFIDIELKIQERIFKGMKCNETLSKNALDQMRIAYNSTK